jgi:hypothetical protein
LQKIMKELIVVHNLTLTYAPYGCCPANFPAVKIDGGATTVNLLRSADAVHRRQSERKA